MGSTASPRRARRELSTHGRRLVETRAACWCNNRMGQQFRRRNNEGCCAGGCPVPRLARRVSSRRVPPRAQLCQPVTNPTLAPRETRAMTRRGWPPMDRLGTAQAAQPPASYQHAATGPGKLGLARTVAGKGCLALGQSDGAAPRRAGHPRRMSRPRATAPTIRRRLGRIAGAAAARRGAGRGGARAAAAAGAAARVVAENGLATAARAARAGPSAPPWRCATSARGGRIEVAAVRSAPPASRPATCSWPSTGSRCRAAPRPRSCRTPCGRTPSTRSRRRRAPARARGGRRRRARRRRLVHRRGRGRRDVGARRVPRARRADGSRRRPSAVARAAHVRPATSRRPQPRAVPRRHAAACAARLPSAAARRADALNPDAATPRWTRSAAGAPPPRRGRSPSTRVGRGAAPRPARPAAAGALPRRGRFLRSAFAFMSSSCDFARRTHLSKNGRRDRGAHGHGRERDDDVGRRALADARARHEAPHAVRRRWDCGSAGLGRRVAVDGTQRSQYAVVHTKRSGDDQRRKEDRRHFFFRQCLVGRARCGGWLLVGRSTGAAWGGSSVNYSDRATT